MMEPVDGPIQRFPSRKVPSLLQVVTADASIPPDRASHARGASGDVHHVDRYTRTSGCDEMRVERWNNGPRSAQTTEQVERGQEI